MNAMERVWGVKVGESPIEGDDDKKEEEDQLSVAFKLKKTKEIS